MKTLCQAMRRNVAGQVIVDTIVRGSSNDKPQFETLTTDQEPSKELE